MDREIVPLQHDHTGSSLYSEDLAPVPAEKRTWNTWHLTALWIGMAVCIPTYLLASYMIRAGLSWFETLAIIGLANLIITIPMVLNGHAGVKYGIPFPVLGRASFGIHGIHIAALLRGLVACGWFGIQTWVGGLAVYAIFNVISGGHDPGGLTLGKFVGFAIFWCINMYFILKGTESIRWLESYAAPILLLIGFMLIGWGVLRTGGFARVLAQSEELGRPTASLIHEPGATLLDIEPLRDKESGRFRAMRLQLLKGGNTEPLEDAWMPIFDTGPIWISDLHWERADVIFMGMVNGGEVHSSIITAVPRPAEGEAPSRWPTYLLWLTAMVGFWATMSLSIADITRYARSQRSQVAGQFLGLPTTMLLYSFVGVFATCAAIINFDDILIAEDAPWDPVSLIAKFESPWVVVIAQFAMIIATLSTNIAANVIAPANAFSNLSPKRISFRTGGLITGIIGILICPWLLMDQISSLLVFVSGLLGPVLGIMLCDYFAIRSKRLDLDELYNERGRFMYGGSGFNRAAVIAFAAGVLTALAGYWVPALNFLYTASWFSGFGVSFATYYVMMPRDGSVRKAQRLGKPLISEVEPQ